MRRLFRWGEESANERRRRVLAAVLYAPLAVLSADLLTREGRPEAWLAVAAVPVALIGRVGPLGIGVAFVLGGAWLRFLMGSLGEVAADQLAVTEAAIALVLEGGNPYGVGYAESVPPGSPFVYGPLMLAWGWTGAWGEALASVATLGLVAWTRSWVTLAVLASFPLFVIITTVGINDSTPGFFITAALVALRTRPVLGGVLLGVAIGLKPYAVSWVPGVIGYGGFRAAVGSLAAAAVAWAPLLLWGPESLWRSIELAGDVRARSAPGGALGIPTLRTLAAPVAIAALLVRRWRIAALSGSAIFVIVLFFDTWASYGYWLAVLPITGIAIETAVSDRWTGSPQATGAA